MMLVKAIPEMNLEISLTLVRHKITSTDQEITRDLSMGDPKKLSILLFFFF